MDDKEKTRYPSIDKPWLKYYSKDAINAPLPECSLYDYLLENNIDNLDDIALVFFGKQISFRYMFQQIDMWTSVLLSKGVVKGTVVSILSITSPEIIYIFYALSRIGAIANMLDPRMPIDILKCKIADSNSRYYVSMDIFDDTSNILINECAFIERWIINVYDSMPIAKRIVAKAKTGKILVRQSAVSSLPNNENIEQIEKKDNGNNIVLIEYTGGTTGYPKGVMLTNNQINAVVSQYKRSCVSLNRRDLWQTVSAPFIAYVMIISTHLPLCCGITCNITIYDPETIAKDIVKHNYNHIAGNPAVWNKVINAKECKHKDFSDLLMPITGADAMPEELWKKINDFLKKHNCKNVLCNGYGMTELASAVAVNLSPEIFKMGSVGIPFINTTIAAFDEQSHELPFNEIGELCVYGPSIMSGYINDQIETEKMIKTHYDGKKWLHTGDYGYIDADGFVFVEGRIKRMIVRENGAKVFPNEIERILCTHRSVDSACVVGISEKDTEGKVPVAFIVLTTSIRNSSESKTQIENELIDICNKELPDYEHPYKYFYLDVFPLTSVGKVDYRALEKLAKEGVSNV